MIEKDCKYCDNNCLDKASCNHHLRTGSCFKCNNSECEIVFYCSPSKIKNGENVYCSQECYSAVRKRKIIINNCRFCGEEIETWESHNQQFCDRECHSAHRRNNFEPPNKKEVDLLVCSRSGCDNKLNHKQTVRALNKEKVRGDSSHYCSRKCKSIDQNYYEGPKNCLNCGRFIKQIGKKSCKKWCDRDCYNEYRSVKNKIPRKVTKNKYAIKSSKQLLDSYVSGVIQTEFWRNGIYFPKEDIPEGLVQAKRQHIKIDRKIKDKTQ